MVDFYLYGDPEALQEFLDSLTPGPTLSIGLVTRGRAAHDAEDDCPGCEACGDSEKLYAVVRAKADALELPDGISQCEDPDEIKAIVGGFYDR